MRENLSMVVLAGGRSSRMGQDKAWMMLDGQPLIERVVRRLLPLADEVLVSTKDPSRCEELLQSLPIPGHTVADQYAGAGPLAGMQAGLSAARNDLALIVAADMPFVSLPLIEHMTALATGCDGVVPLLYDDRRRTNLLEPLHALYRRSCLPAIERHLADNDRQAFCFFPEVRIRAIQCAEIKHFDPDLLSFFNVNTPEDWLAAQVIAEGSAQS